ncbi:hypothetical protein I352_05756 [Cryptococcus deuterogattii MMRL2647]|nr:hypothetical protein I352_05756 [Cryptococcus deuterogattii MMRL2647]
MPGFGLSNGEGVERLWSTLAALVRLNSESTEEGIYFCGLSRGCQRGTDAEKSWPFCKSSLLSSYGGLIKRSKALESSIQAWEKKVAEQKAWCEEYGKALEEGDVGRRNELDRVVPGRGLPSEETSGRACQLEQRWVADSLSILWDTYMVPGKFRQDQGLQRQYQDLNYRALAVHHEPHYEVTLPASPDSYVERDDVSWYNSDSADEGGEDEEEQYAEDEEQREERLVEGATTLESSMEIDEPEALSAESSMSYGRI